MNLSGKYQIKQLKSTTSCVIVPDAIVRRWRLASRSAPYASQLVAHARKGGLLGDEDDDDLQYHHPLAFCREHGIFEDTAISFADSTLHLPYGNLAVRCPVCGRSAKPLTGTYEAYREQLKVLLDESVPREALELLKQIAERLQRDEISPEQAKAEAEKISPKAGRLFDVGDWSDNAKATLLAAIFTAAAMVGSAAINSRSNSPPTVQITNQVVVERIIDRTKDVLRDSTALPYIPIPTPRPGDR